MKLSKNSWHARLNKYIYGWNYLASVDCLCPYFWGTILALLCLPLWLLGHGIERVVNAVPERNWKFPSVEISYDTKQKIGTIFAYSLLALFATVITIGIGFALVEYGIIHILFWLGIIVLISAGIIGIAFGVNWINEKYKEWRYDHPKEKKPNLLVEMFKAKKNKHCPLVQWEQ